MVFNKNRQGQAAIEFLMTYGWMLLVVLIVGALIFSFVDFGSLLPNKVELNNNIRAAQTESFASRNDRDDGTEGYVLVVFTYTGSQRVSINPSTTNSIIKPNLGSNDCHLSWIKNTDTDSTSKNSAYAKRNAVPNGAGAATLADDSDVVFINGQTGIAEYDCSTVGFLENDVLEGKITLVFKNAKTQVPTPSAGPIRLGIND